MSYVALVALDVEYDAVRAYLTDLQTLVHRGTRFEIGTVRGTSVRMALARVSGGNREAAVLVERASKMFRPHALLVVGIAGALHSDVRLGDVVVATYVHAYHGGIEESAEFLARPRGWRASYELEQYAQHVARTASWEAGPGRFKIYFRPVVAGDVVLNSLNGHVIEFIRRHYNDAAAVEMESAGAAEAAHLNQVPFLAIRGISDLADGRKMFTDVAGWQREAASHAALFAVALVVTRPEPRRASGTEATAGGTAERKNPARVQNNVKIRGDGNSVVTGKTNIIVGGNIHYGDETFPR